ncbi:MAG: HD domain-containing protein [Bacteroidota bacterium]
MKIQLDLAIFKIINQVTNDIGVQAWVIGGYVRDRIMKRPTTDIDIVVLGDGPHFAQMVANAIGNNTEVAVFKNFGTAMLHFQGLQIEFVGARKESYHVESRKPTVESGTLKDDQLRRDFTINSMSISLNSDDYGTVIDPFNGLNDIQIQIIRTPLDPNLTFSDDPLRMLRAIRFASQLHFDIETVTFNAISQNLPRLSIVSMERIVEEINKIIMSSTPSYGFKLMDISGLLQLILPQLAALKGVEIVEKKGHKDNFLHTLEVLDNLSKHSDNLWLRWAALLHDIAKPLTKRFQPDQGWTFHGHEVVGAKVAYQIFKNMRLPLNEKLDYVQKLISLHLRPIALSEDQVSDSAVRRLIVDAGDDIEDLMMLCEADITSKNPLKVKKHLANFNLVRQKMIEIDQKDSLRNWQPPISGEVIMETFQISPCRQVGVIKEAIREAILDGLIPNTFEDAFSLMLSEGEKLGLSQQKKE